MGGISNRLRQAIDFLERSGYAKNDREIAKKVGVTASALNMAKKGSRVPTWEMLLDFCDHYPINFWWLRSGEGDMIGNGDRHIALLQEIARLERKIAELEGRE